MQDRSHALSCTLVSTEHSEGESLFYIISPKDIVVAKERDQDDHIDWLLDKKKYEVSVFFLRIQSSRLGMRISVFPCVVQYLLSDQLRAAFQQMCCIEIHIINLIRH